MLYRCDIFLKFLKIFNIDIRFCTANYRPSTKLVSFKDYQIYLIRTNLELTNALIHSISIDLVSYDVTFPACLVLCLRINRITLSHIQGSIGTVSGYIIDTPPTEGNDHLTA